MQLAEELEKATQRGPVSFSYLDQVPRHLWPMLLLTPRSNDLLRAAWPSLSLETQCQVMGILVGFLDHEWARARPVRELGLTSEFEYVRYLAGAGGAEVEATDSSALVRSTQCHDWGAGFGPGCGADFWALGRHERLNLIAKGCVDDEKLVEIVNAAIEKESLASIDERREVILEYLLRPSYLSKTPSYEASQIWDLAFRVDEETATWLAYCAPISRVPERKRLEALSPRVFAALFRRNDFRDLEARKHFFWRALEGGKANTFPLHEIVTHHFQLELDEFERLRALPLEQRRDVFFELGFAKNLQLWTYEAIIDEMKRLNTEAEQHRYYEDYNADVRWETVDARLAAYKTGQWDQDLRMQQLYLMAREQTDYTHDWDVEGPGGAQLKSLLDPDDPYQKKRERHPLRLQGIKPTGDIWHDFRAYVAAWRGEYDEFLEWWGLDWEEQWSAGAEEQQTPSGEAPALLQNSIGGALANQGVATRNVSTVALLVAIAALAISVLA